MSRRCFRKRNCQSRSFQPRLEALEVRLPFSADGLSIAVELGDVTPGLNPAELTVLGGENVDIFTADVALLAGGDHLFIYADDASESTVHFFGRITTAGGAPGPAMQQLVTFNLDPLARPEDVRFSADGTDDGGFVFSWSDGVNVFAQRFGPELSPTSGVVEVARQQVPGPPSLAGLELAATVFSDGRIGIAYPDPDDGRVSFQVYSADLETELESWQDPDGQDLNESPAFHLHLDEVDHGNDDIVRLTWTTQFINKPLEWSLHTATIDDVGNVSTDQWDVVDFYDLPQVEPLAQGGYALVGTTFDGLNSDTIVQIFDDQRVLQREVVLVENPLPADLPSVVTFDNTTFAVGYLVGGNEGGLFVQPFTSAGDEIGEPIRLNENPLYGEMHGGVIGLSDDSFAGYWLGYALDNMSPAVFTRTLRLESTEFEVSIHDPLSDVNQSDFVIIEGLDPSSGLNLGERISESAWKLQVNQLEDVVLLNSGQRQTLSLQISLVSSSDDTLLAATSPSFGTEQDDRLSSNNQMSHLDGRDGEDTLVLEGRRDQFTIDLLEEDTYRLTSQEAHDLVVSQIEFFEFDDVVVPLTELLTPSTDPPNAPEQNAPEQNESDNAVDEIDSNDDSQNSSSSPPINEMQSPDVLVAGASALPVQPVIFDEPINRPSPKQNSIRSIDAVHTENEPPDVSRNRVEQTEHKPRVRHIQKKRTNDEVTRQSDKHAERVEEPGESLSIDVSSSVPLVSANASGIPAAASEIAVQAVISSDLVGPSTVGSLAAPSPIAQTQQNVQPLMASTDYSAMPSRPMIQQAVDGPADDATSIDTTLKTQSVSFASPVLSVEPAFDSEFLFATLDTIEEQVQHEQLVAEVVVGSAVVVATGASVANIAWILRGSVLLTKLMSSMPIWIAFDPLPLLGSVDGLVEPESAAESLVDIASNKT